MNDHCIESKFILRQRQVLSLFERLPRCPSAKDTCTSANRWCPQLRANLKTSLLYEGTIAVITTGYVRTHGFLVSRRRAVDVEVTNRIARYVKALIAHRATYVATRIVGTTERFRI